jgi:hypothetical protein
MADTAADIADLRTASPDYAGTEQLNTEVEQLRAREHIHAITESNKLEGAYPPGIDSNHV